jgi:hypothetical protein
VFKLKKIISPVVVLAVSLASTAWGALSFTDITSTASVGGPAGGAAGGHGAMWADLTDDNLPELYMPFNWHRYKYPDYFFRNLGEGRFVEEAKKLGLDDVDGGSHGACWTDLDNDGDFDLLNGTTYNWDNSINSNDIFKNSGNLQFSRVTGTVLDSVQLNTRAILSLDMDADGDLDIFSVTGYLGAGDNDPNELYRNDGNFKFTRITSGAAITCPAGQGATDTDYDGDGDIDILASNRGGSMNILRNDGSGNFSLVSPQSIGINHKAQDGITTGDIDNDGDVDLLLVTGHESAKLYLNNGSGRFSYSRSFAKNGYMGGFADLDNDTDLDIVFPGTSAVYLNNGNGTFTQSNLIPNSYHPDPRGISFADIDNDGDLDVLSSGKRAPNKLYRNNFNAGNWIKLRLYTKNGQIGAFGAKVKVYSRNADGTNNRLIGYKEAKSNEGYLVQNDTDLHFGLAAHKSVNIHVKFLGGQEIVWKGLQGSRTVILDAANPNKAYDALLNGPYMILLK